jgi:hypothetical protein
MPLPLAMAWPSLIFRLVILTIVVPTLLFTIFFFFVDLNHGTQQKIDRVANRDRGCSSACASLAYPIKY